MKRLLVRRILEVSAIVLCVAATPIHDGGAPSPAKVSEAFADAWGYTKIQTSLLEHQRDLVNTELARLAERRKTLATRAKADYQVDFDGGDSFDEKTLEINRK